VSRPRPVRAVARRREGFVNDVEIEDGAHGLVVDEPTAAGGTDAGPAPTRLVAAALASCISITMEMYARRKGWQLGAVEVAVDVEYDGYVPSSFNASVWLPEALDAGQRERLLKVAEKCPVHKTLAGEIAVTVAARAEELPGG
jgi:putative redox protein